MARRVAICAVAQTKYQTSKWDVRVQGMVWEVPFSALSKLAPGGTLKLTVGGAYYRADLSYVVWPLPVGTKIYAHVDSSGIDPNYGDVMENHEVYGDPYNNIMGPVLVAP